MDTVEVAIIAPLLTAIQTQIAARIVHGTGLMVIQIHQAIIVLKVLHLHHHRGEVVHQEVVHQVVVHQAAEVVVAQEDQDKLTSI